MVLHFADDNLVSLAHKFLAETLRHQIYAFGGAARKDDFARGTCIQEASHRLAARFHQVGSLLAKEVDAAVHVGIHIVILLRHRFHHLARFLRRGGVVEIHEGIFFVNLAPKNGKVVPILFHRPQF